jgi:hypothetical protein
LVIRRLLVASILSLPIIDAGRVFAQGAFPAPLPGQAEAPASRTSPFPPVNGAAPTASPGASATFPAGSGIDDCTNQFMPLRQEAEQRAKLIRAAAERKAPPDEACKLIGDFGQAEIRMMKYIEANAARCGIPPQTAERFKDGHRNTERMQEQVCALAQRHPSAPDKVLGPGDFWIVR